MTAPPDQPIHDGTITDGTLTDGAPKPSRYATISHNIGRIEESLIALLLGLMTLTTFANVVARYGFNSNILWALETTVYLFAWLVLLGTSTCLHRNAHLGIDLLINQTSPKMRQRLALLAVGLSLCFTVIVLKGAWEYWLPFATSRSWYETNDIPAPDLLNLLAPWLNEGEAWEKLPRFIPYFALPLGFALLLWRLIEAAYDVLTGCRDRIICDHEATIEPQDSVEPQDSKR